MLKHLALRSRAARPSRWALMPRRLGLHGFVAFGDSLSDAGNVFDLATTGSRPILSRRSPDLPARAPPATTRAGSRTVRSGPTIVAAHFRAGSPSLNVAYGLAGAARRHSDGLAALIPDLPKQHRSRHAAACAGLGARPLASVWSGANDVFACIEFRERATPARGGGRPSRAARPLIAAGIADIVAFTLPDFGLIPRFAMFQPRPRRRRQQAAARFNAALLAGLAGFERPGGQRRRPDGRAVRRDLFARPGRLRHHRARQPLRRARSWRASPTRLHAGRPFAAAESSAPTHRLRLLRRQPPECPAARGDRRGVRRTRPRRCRCRRRCRSPRRGLRAPRPAAGAAR